MKRPSANDGPPRQRIVVAPDEDGARADVVVARALRVSVRQAREAFEEGRVTRAGRAIAKGERVRGREVLEVVALVPWLLPRPCAWLRVAYEDEGVVVVDKPAGVASHPLARGEGGTVADALAYNYPECSRASDDEREGGLVHRLDTDTSGLLAAARSREEHRELRRAFAEGRVERAYLALVEGAFEGRRTLDAPIAHDASDRRRMVVVTPGSVAKARGEPKPATSEVTALASSGTVTLVFVRTQGGRRHQVRVHLASAGHPLVGDALYGAKTRAARGGHLLHAALLGLPGRPRLVSAPPADFVASAKERGLSGDDVERALRMLRAP